MNLAQLFGNQTVRYRVLQLAGAGATRNEPRQGRQPRVGVGFARARGRGQQVAQARQARELLGVTGEAGKQQKRQTLMHEFRKLQQLTKGDAAQRTTVP